MSPVKSSPVVFF